MGLPTAVGERQHRRLEALDALAGELHRAGFDAERRATGAGRPLLVVTNPARPALLTENVACRTDPDGVTRFAWPWGSWIADTRDLTAAVDEIARVLGGQRG